tara:strand:- start:2 stop:172 length:171 start_codon:yes stop_codon:yes gene_type:complete
MNITSAQYIKFEGQNNTIKVVVDGITKFVPLDPANTDYAEILKQVKEGKLTIKEAE